MVKVTRQVVWGKIRTKWAVQLVSRQAGLAGEVAAISHSCCLGWLQTTATKGEESASDEIVIKIEDQDSKVNDAEDVFVNFESGDCGIYDLVILPKTVRLKKHMIIMKTSSKRVLYH